MKSSTKYFILILTVSNVLYELYRKKYGTQEDLTTGDKEVLPRYKRLIKKFKESVKLRSSLTAFLILISCATNYNRPRSGNFGDRQNPLSFTLPQKEVTQDEFMRFINFISSDQITKDRREIGETIIDNDLGRDIKIVILKYRFHSIINIQGRKENSVFLALAIQTILSGTVPGYYGLRLILEALEKLFDEGKLSKELFQHLLKMFESVQLTPAQLEAIMDLLKKADESTSTKSK